MKKKTLSDKEMIRRFLVFKPTGIVGGVTAVGVSERGERDGKVARFEAGPAWNGPEMGV